MAIKFSKYHGCGNDFICIDGRELSIDYIPFAKQWCQRGFGVGADGILVLEESVVADFKMTVVNADGSIPEMCGNGLRCFIAYLIHQRLTNNTILRIETLAGIGGQYFGFSVSNPDGVYSDGEGCFSDESSRI